MRDSIRPRDYSVQFIGNKSTGEEESLIIPQVRRISRESLTKRDVIRVFQRFSPEVRDNIRSNF